MRHWRTTVLIISASAALTAALLGGCPGSNSSDKSSTAPPYSTLSIPSVSGDTTIRFPSRHYRTGVVPSAFANNDIDQGRQYFGRVAKSTAYGDCFVARPRMDWERWGPNGGQYINADLQQAVAIARLGGQKFVVLEVDPVADRRHVGILPPELEGKTFADPEVRDPVKRFAVALATQLKPDYLAISVEINGYYESNPEDFENFVTLHKETYDLVKALNPNVQFFVAFNLEALQGFFAGLDQYATHPPQWFLIDKFEPKLDAVGFSTLPFAFYITPLQLPDDYLSRIERYTTRDILFTEVGWPGSPDSPLYTLETQRDYLIAMASQMDRTKQAKLITWTTMYDAEPDSVTLITNNFKILGLYNHLDEPKPALDIWKQIHALPYQP